MAWQQLTLRIAATELPRTEALLRLAGAASVAISDDGDTPILEPAPGATPLWPQLTVRALFAESLDLAGIGAIIGPPDDYDATLTRIEDDEIERAARQPVEPIAIGPRLTLVPAETLAAAGPHALGLHMGLAFGTGRHPTTRLCLQWLEQAALEGCDVLDYGCGTGVLALAALKLGARRATAIDNEPQALESTRRNAELNGAGPALEVGAPESLGGGSYKLILANILAQPLLDLAARFAALQPPGGRIVLSGILESQLEPLETHYAAWYEDFERRVLSGWALLTASRRSGYDPDTLSGY